MLSKELSELRKNYTLQSLDLTDVDLNPVRQFELWLDQALNSNLPEANAMVLATAGSSGQPRARVVLLKGVVERGFVFYTNYKSRKGLDLSHNPRAGLCFNWLELERQVRIDGKVEKVSEEESTAYFNSRPFESRIGALASHQSSVVRDRQQLETTFKHLYDEYEGKSVPKPWDWGGYVVIPEVIEFWQGRPGRLHDRIEFKKDHNNDWSISRLSP